MNTDLEYLLRKTAIAAILIYGAIVSSALAQTANLPAEEIVVSATRSPTSALQTGPSVTVITAADIDARQYQFVADVLEDTVGVHVAQTGSLGGVAGVSIRGSQTSQTLVIVDGVVLNDPSAPSGGFNFANLDTADIARIEILRGPQSILYGADAIGGVISIATKAFETPLSVFLEGGSRGYVRGAASLAGEAGPMAARLTVQGQRTDGISKAANGIETDGYRSLGASLKTVFDLGSDWRLDLNGRINDSRAEIDGFLPPIFVLADSDDVEETRDYALVARLNQGLPEDTFSQALTLAYNDISRQNFSSGAPSFGGDGDRLSAEYLGRYYSGNGFSLLTGGEIERTGVDVSGIEEDETSGAVFALAEFKPLEPLTLSAGVRRDEFSNFEGATTARVAGAWQIVAGGVLRASWGEGFKAPSLFQLNFSLFGGPPNNNLRPEHSSAVDVGGEIKLVEKLTAKAAFFHQTFRDLIDFDFPTGGYVNIDRARTRGAEFELDWRPAPRAQVSLAYTYLDAIDKTTGARLLRRPKHKGVVSADVQPIKNVSVGASLRMNGEEIDAGGVNDAYATLDVRASMAVDGGMELYGRVENVTDTEYQDVLGYGEPGVSVFAGVRVKL